MKNPQTFLNDYVKPASEYSGDFLGVDFGITNLATDSRGRHYPSSSVDQQSFKDVSLACVEGRLFTDPEHKIAIELSRKAACELVAKAKSLGIPIAVEKLILDEFNTPSKRLYKLFIEKLKAQSLKLKVPLKFVAASKTSVTCPECGHIDPASRLNQANFVCNNCAHSGHADVIAARNIANRGKIKTLKGN